jgi:hypothetical protein
MNMKKLAWLAASVRREGAPDGTPAARSEGGIADDRDEERLELSIEELDARLAPGGAVVSSTVKPGKTAGWGC